MSATVQAELKRMWIFPGAQTPISLKQAKVHRTYVGRLERGESGVTVDSLAAILAGLVAFDDERLDQLTD